MYIYGNTCSVNNECESGYSLYFPCVGTLTRGENACFDFYIVNNATKKEIDLRLWFSSTISIYKITLCIISEKFISDITSENFSTCKDLIFSG